MTATNSIAIFGGTFDPIHNGHIHLIKEILNSGKFTKVVVVPAGNPWRKTPVAPADDRLEMSKLALKEIDADVSDCEVRRGSPSYAIDTVKDLEELYPGSTFTWIIGSDALIGLSSWHQIQELASQIQFLIILRPGHDLQKTTIPSYIQWQSIEIDALDISATQIRKLVGSGGEISSLVPDSVARYIQSKGLYGAA